MKLNMSIIKDYLYDLAIESRLHNSFFLRLTAPVEIHNADVLLDKHLYLGSEEEFLSVKEYPKSIVYYGEKRIDEMPFPNSCEVIHIDGTLPPQTVWATIRDVFETFSEWESQLFKSLVDENNLNKLVEIGAKMLRNPFAIMDNSGRLLSWSGRIPSTYKNPIWESLFEKGFPMEYDERWNSGQGMDAIFDENSPVVTEHKYKGTKYNALTKVVYDKNVRLATLGMTEVNSLFTVGEISLVAYLADNIFLRFFKMNHAINTSFTARGKLLSNILNGIDIDEMIISKHIFLPHGKKFYLLYFHSQTEISMERLWLYESWLNRLPNSNDVVAKYLDSLVIVITAASDDEARTIAKQYCDIITPRPRVGVSRESSNFKECSDLLRQAVYAYKCGVEAYDEKRDVFSFSEFSFRFLMDILSANPDSHLAYNMTVQLLDEYDSQNGTDYLNTAKTLYENAGNKRKTATDIFLHRNTLNYRLEKIAEIIGRKEVFYAPEQLDFLLTYELVTNRNQTTG